MPFFNTIDQISAIAKVTSSNAFQFTTILPYLNQGDAKYIQPLFDAETWDNLQSGYPSYGGTDDPLTKLLPYIQNASANFGLFLGIDSLSVKVSDAGITRTETTVSPTAYKYQVDRYREALNNAANDAIDAMLAFLEENIADYDTWATSSQYKEQKKFFINCATDFSKFYNIRQSRRVFMLLLPSMDIAEDFYIAPAIGLSYFDELKEKILDGDLNTDDKYIVAFIQKALAHFTMYEAYNTLNFIITDGGLILNTVKAIKDSNDETVIASQQQVGDARTQALDRGNAYIKIAVDYLNKNASVSKYPTYFADSSVYVAPATGDTSVFDNKRHHKTYFAG